MDNDALKDKFDKASNKLKKEGQKPGGGSAQIEAEYGLAYQELVREGIALPLKKKYRSA